MTIEGIVEILVEGPDDQGFWGGLLREGYGWIPWNRLSKAEIRELEVGPALKSKEARTWGFVRPDRRRVARITPFQEQQGIDEPRQFFLRQKVKNTRPGLDQPPVIAIVECVDDDGTEGDNRRHTPATLADWLERESASGRLEGVTVSRRTPTGVRLSTGIDVHRVVWWLATEDVPLDAEGRPIPVPLKQTLERLAAASIAVAHPDRNREVQAFLAGRSNPPLLDDGVTVRSPHKSYAGALWAGWAAHDGWSDFFANTWHEAASREWLLDVLGRDGAREALDALFG